jgi:N-acylglucosamine 2-epimerase
MIDNWTVTTDRSVNGLAHLLEKQLLDDVVPFWLKYGANQKDGALNTCIRDDGQTVSGDRYMLSQCRGLWTFSALYNRMDRRPEFLTVAQGIYNYLKVHGRDEHGSWLYRRDRTANAVEGSVSIFPAGFAIYGLAEYFLATKDEAAVALAIETYDSVKADALAWSGNKLLYPLPNSELVAHSVFMVYGLALLELALVTGEKRILEEAKQIGEVIFSKFINPKSELMYEYIPLSRIQEEDPLSHVIIPGHAVESMWFLVRLFNATGQEARIDQLLAIIQTHLEIGWDQEFGGFFLAIDDRGCAPHWREWDSKPWWIVTEVLLALTLCFQETEENWCMEWYKKVQRYAYGIYPERTHGEWRQKLNRKGIPANSDNGLPVKDPFHLPRSLILGLEALRSK